MRSLAGVSVADLMKQLNAEQAAAAAAAAANQG
jgi:ribosomal protein L12E/L44/L45/RPP1/RPP2